MPAYLNLNLILYAFFAVLLGIGFLFGFMRGFKKSLYNFIVMFIFFAIFFLTINLVVNFLWTLTIPSIGSIVGNMLPEAKHATSLQEVLTLTLKANFGDVLGNTIENAQLLEFINALALLILKIIYTLIYFILIRIIYRIITFIIRLFIIRKKKDDKAKKQEPKRRFVGGVFGFLRGGITVGAFLIIFGGLVDITDNAFKVVPSDIMADIEDKVPLENNIKAYNNNLVVKSVRLLKLPDSDGDKVPFDLYLFDKVMSFDYDDNVDDNTNEIKTIAIRKEIGYIGDIGEVVNNTGYTESHNLSDITPDDIEKAFNALSKSNLFTTLLPLSIEVAAENLDTDINIPTDELYEIDWEQEMLTIKEVTKVTFELINTSGVTGENNDYKTVTFNQENVEGLFDELSKSEVAKLAAYHAVQPLIEKAGSSLEAYINVPEGFTKEDWGNEYKAIGSIAGQIAKENITLQKLENDSTSEMIKTMADINLTIVLNSKIVTQSLIHILEGNAVEEFNVFVIPEDVEWKDIYAEDGVTIVQEGELRKILVAISAIADVSEDVDFENLGLDVIAEFDTPTINTIFESRVFVATVSSMITEMDLGSTPLVIADGVFDEEGYIKKTELTALATSAREIFTTLACDEGTTCDTGFDVKKAFDLTDEQFTTLFTSQIISNTIGNIIIDKAGDVLTIPETTLTTIFVNQTEKKVIEEDEIKKVFRAVSTLGFTDIDNLTFDASFINNLAVDDEHPTDLDTTKTLKLFNSQIVHATLSKMLIDLDKSLEKPDNVLIIPYKYQYEGEASEEDVRYLMKDLADTTVTDYNTGNVIELISTKELDHMLASVLKLEINDFDTMDALNLGKVLNNTTTLLNSSIVHATITEQLMGLGTDIIIIPEVDIQDQPIKVSYGDIGEETEFIERNELNHLLDALNLFPDFTNVNSFSGTIALDKFFHKVDGVDNPDCQTNRDKLLASAIMQATISKQIIKINDNGGDILVPDHITVPKTDTTYVIDNEIRAIIDNLEILDILDVNDFNGTVKINRYINDEANQTTLLSSSIMYATVSKKINALDSDTIIVPNESIHTTTINIDGSDVDVSGEAINYLVTDEIKDFLNALGLLLDGDDLTVDSMNSDFNLSKITSEDEIIRKENIAKLVKSKIVQATLSKKLQTLDGNDVLIVPLYTESNVSAGNTTDEFKLRKGLDETDYLGTPRTITVIDEIELKAILNAFALLNYGDLNITNISATDFFKYRTDLLESSIIQATISDRLLVDAGEFIIPDSVRLSMEDPENPADTYVLEVEINAILDTLEALGLDQQEFNAVSITPVQIRAISDKSTLLNSESIHLTIANNILTSNFTVLDNTVTQYGTVKLIVPVQETEDKLADNNPIKQIKHDELVYLLDAIVLIADDFNAEIDASAITSKTEPELTTMLNSISIHVTIDNMLHGNNAIKVPDDATTTILNIQTVDPDDKLIQTGEIIKFIIAANAIITDDSTFTNVSFNLNVIKTMALDPASSGTVDTVLDSKIVQYTLTDQLGASKATIIALVETENISYVEDNNGDKYINKDGFKYAFANNLF